MIDSRGFKKEYFMSRLARIFMGIHPEHDGIVYLGGGYWRAKVHTDEDGRFLGVSLINPDRSPAEIATVEKAFWLLP